MEKQLELLIKRVDEQAKQIDAMKRAMAVLQNRLIQTTQKTERTYHSGRKNTNDIMTISKLLGKGR